MDDEGGERMNSEVRQYRIPGRSATKTSLEENKSDERVVAVTTLASSDGTLEKAMRIASFDELEESSGAG